MCYFNTLVIKKYPEEIQNHVLITSFLNSTWLYSKSDNFQSLNEDEKNILKTIRNSLCDKSYGDVEKAFMPCWLLLGRNFRSFIEAVFIYTRSNNKDEGKKYSDIILFQVRKIFKDRSEEEFFELLKSFIDYIIVMKM